jgi:hypothetical protein
MKAGAPLIGLGSILGCALCGSLLWSLQPEVPGHHWYDTFAEHAPDWFVALFTLALTVSTIFLWRATKKLATDAKESSERQLRAYPGVIGGSIEIRDNKFHIAIEVVNTSTTPAYRFRYDMAYQLCAIGTDIRFDHVTLRNMTWDMAPHSKTTMRISGDIDDKQIVALAQSGDILLLFRGRAEYEDAFRKARHIDFVYRNGAFAKVMREGRYSDGRLFAYEVWVCSEPEPISYSSN